VKEGGGGDEKKKKSPEKNLNGGGNHGGHFKKLVESRWVGVTGSGAQKRKTKEQWSGMEGKREKKTSRGEALGKFNWAAKIGGSGQKEEEEKKKRKKTQCRGEPFPIAEHLRTKSGVEGKKKEIAIKSRGNSKKNALC